MTTGDNTEQRKKSKFWIIALVTLLVLTITTTTGDILDTNGGGNASVALLIPSMPGFILYVLVTGDIHGWQPGPIGQVGRIAVTTFGAWLFWTPLIYWIYRKITKK